MQIGCGDVMTVLSGLSLIEWLIFGFIGANATFSGAFILVLRRSLRRARGEKSGC